MPKRIQAAVLPGLVLLAFFWCAPGMLAFSPKLPPLVRVARLEEVAAGLATALEVRKPVQVVVVPRNDLVVSVEPLLAGDGYRVVFEQRFFDRLDEEELTAALAHEIGHVWIYSHHPFLQTEALANEIALKVVQRKPLETLYAKLWTYTGLTGNLVELLGSDK
jgi:Zn-dependent protease with chaperone function